MLLEKLHVCEENKNVDKIINKQNKEEILQEQNENEKMIETKHSSIINETKFGTDYNFKRQIVWKNVIGFMILHICGFYGALLCLTKAKLLTVIYLLLMIALIGQGITAGAHRLWTHRSYKVKMPLKVLLLILQTATGQNCLWVWVRDHRQHHRYSDTDADPHNINRGLFFSHMGWLMSKKHPLVLEMGKTIDMSDLEDDPWVMFQKKYYKTLYFIFALVIPIYIPVYLWNEDIWTSLLICYFTRYVFLLHVTWSVNSLAHYIGYKPYNRNINPVDSKFVSIIAGGEGWHNFHHVFPWDYRTGEWGGQYNIASCWIELMQYLGQAYDLKKVPQSMILKRMAKTGDGTKYEHIHHKIQ